MNNFIPKTKKEAREYAIEWQDWASKKKLSYKQLAAWQDMFYALGEKFGLLEEFKANGIL